MEKTSKHRFHHLGFIYAVLMVIFSWEIAYRLFNSFVIPEPFQVIFYTISDLPTLLKHLASSSWRILLGLSLTIVIGGIVGVGIGISTRLDRYITPIIYLFYPVPRIAFLPVFMILFGLGDTSKIVLIFAISVFHLMINIRDGIRAIPSNMFLSAHVLGLNFKQKLFYMVLPAILPTLFTSLKIVLGSSIAALFFAENYATRQGIGYYIMNAWIKADYVEMYSGIIAMSIFGVVLFKVIDLLDAKVCKWK